MKNKPLTTRNQESGKLKGCSGQTEQPDENESEQCSETETKKTLNDFEEKCKYIVLPIQF